MGKHKSQAVRDQAVVLYHEGLTAPEIGARVGVGSTTVYRWLRSAGISPSDLITSGQRARFGGITEQTADEMECLYRGGLSIYQIAEKLDDTGDRVHRILRQRGVAIRRRGGVRRPILGSDRSTVLAMWEAGEAVQAISDAVGAGRERVKMCLRDAGIDPEKRIRRGERHIFWKSGAHITTHGYRYVIVRDGEPFAEMRNELGYVAEHRLVMARTLGRPLDKHETVHHINGVRDDNRLENLQLRTGRHGKGIVVRCLDCGSHNVEAVKIDDPSDAVA